MKEIFETKKVNKFRCEFCNYTSDKADKVRDHEEQHKKYNALGIGSLVECTEDLGEGYTIQIVGTVIRKRIDEFYLEALVEYDDGRRDWFADWKVKNE